MDLQALRRLARYLAGKPRLVYRFAWEEAPCLTVFSDTDYAGCRVTRRSTSGGCACYGDHLVKHWSSTQKSVTLSSGEAELSGLVKAAAEGLGLQSLAADLGLKTQLRLCADSSAAIGICRRSGIGRVRQLAVGQLWVQERLRAGAFTLAKIRGEVNTADLLTKHVPTAVMQAHVKALGLLPLTGRAETAPAAITGVDARMAA